MLKEEKCKSFPQQKTYFIPMGPHILGGLHLSWLTFQSDSDVANPEPFVDQENISVFAPRVSDVP